MPKFTGLTSDTAKYLWLDAGAWYKDYDLAKPHDQQKDKLIGATAGGGSFSAVLSTRQVEVDGKRGPVKGMDEPEEWEVTQTANVKQITADNLRMALGAADVTDVTDNANLAGYKKITGRTEYKDSDYATNITWIGRLSGSLKPVIIVIYNALATNGLAVNHEDKNEAVVPITLRGSFESPDSEQVPFAIYYPPVA